MNRFGLWLAHWLALRLDSQDRDSLLGDQKELGLSGFRASREALGLVVRRQYQLSTADESGLGPWWRLAPFFYVLISQSVELSRHFDVDSLLGFSFYACWGAIVAVLSWTVGFLLGSLSGRAHRVNSALLAAFWLVCLGYWWAQQELSTAELTLHGLLFVLPVVAGFRRGALRKIPSTFKSVIVAAVPPIIFLCLVILITSGEASGGSLLTWVALAALAAFTFTMTAVPGALLVILSQMHRRGNLPQQADEAAP